MIKQIRYSCAALLLLGFAIVSCNRDFLDDRSPDSGTLQNTIVNIRGMQTALNGAYSSMATQWTYGRNVLAIPDLIADNAFISANNSGWLGDFYGLSWTKESQDVRELWLGLYNTVARANFVINSNSTLNPDTLSDADKKLYDQYLGEALAIRAMAHFTLLDFFADIPKAGQDTLGVPYVKTLVDSKPAEALKFPSKRLSLAKTYEAIEGDFNQALKLFKKGDATRQEQRVYLGPAAVDLLLSRLYLYNKEYDSAISYANKAIKLVPMVKKNAYVDYWQKENTNLETVFEIAQNNTDNTSTDSYAYLLSKDGYGQQLAYPGLIDSMASNDVRRGVFKLADNRKKDKPHYGYYINKYILVNGSPTLNIKILRISEAYLNKVEAEYYTGGDALGDLNKFAAERDGVVYSSSGSQLLADILKERRFELCFEGHRLFDLRHNELNFIKGVDPSKQKTITFLNEDDKHYYYLPIPRAQIKSLNNEAVQNTGY